MNQLPAYTTVRASMDNELPAYKPTLLYHDIVLVKKELSSPFDIAKDRSWDIAIIEINSTQLNIYKLKNLNNISSYLWKLLDDENAIDERRNIQKKVINTDNSFTNKALMEWLLLGNTKSIPLDIIQPYMGSKTNSYTLQDGKIGSATDYHKKNYTLRLRLELHQFLTTFANINRFNKFFNNLIIAMDLSKPLDQRSLPKEKTVPNEISRFRIENFQNYYAKNCINSDRNLSNYRRHTIDHTSALNREELIMANLKPRSNSLNDMVTPPPQDINISSNSSAVFSDSESTSTATSWANSPDTKLNYSNIADEYVDENLIYSLTCITSLEAKKEWKGTTIISGDHKSKSLDKFKSKPSKSNSNYQDKLFINTTSLSKFHKILSSNNGNMSCKEFVLMDAGLVEAI